MHGRGTGRGQGGRRLENGTGYVPGPALRMERLSSPSPSKSSSPYPSCVPSVCADGGGCGARSAASTTGRGVVSIGGNDAAAVGAGVVGTASAAGARGVSAAAAATGADAAAGVAGAAVARAVGVAGAGLAVPLPPLALTPLTLPPPPLARLPLAGEEEVLDFTLKSSVYAPSPSSSSSPGDWGPARAGCMGASRRSAGMRTCTIL